MSTDFSPLQVGQTVRITKRRLVPGRPVLDDDAWVDDVTIGVIDALKRADGGVWLCLCLPGGGAAQFHVGITPLGVRLNDGCLGQYVQIRTGPPEQGRLI